jgi:hypothetical protein
VQRRLQIRVRDERDAARQLDVRLRRDLGGDRGVLVDARQERRGQDGDQHRPGQGRAERRAEVGRGVLQPADLRALVVPDGGDRDAAEL